MAALTSLGRVLRLDLTAWERLAKAGTLAGAVLVVAGTYLLLAFDRFGIQGFVEARATTRMVLTGVYGWLGLSFGSWLTARVVWQVRAPFELVLRLFGHAHLALLVVAVAIQFLSVTLRLSDVVIWLALFAVFVWMPLQLVAAAQVALGLTRGYAMLVLATPFVAWLLIVGRWLETQFSHLL